MPIDWPALRSRLPARLADVELGKFSRAPDDTYLSGAWRLNGRPVTVYLECDPRTEDFEAATARARSVRRRLAETIGQARLFAAAHLAEFGEPDPAQDRPRPGSPPVAATHLAPGALWFFGDGTWSVHLKDGDNEGLSGIFWGQSIVVEFEGDHPTRATVED